MAEATTDHILKGALALADRGYKVFPIGANKRPAIEGGFYAATDDPETIRGWAREGRLKSIGVATGLPSGVDVTDADTEEARDRLTKEYGEPHVYTRRGGHWYWKAPGKKVKSKPLGERLDSKGDGGYVVAPPSTGKVWVNGIPDPQTLPVIPDELVPQDTAATSAPAEDLTEECFEAAVQVLADNYPEPGDQYECGLHLAGFLQGNGVSEQDTFNLMLAALEKQSGGVDAEAETNIGRVTSTTAQKVKNNEHVTGGPSVEEYVPGLPKKLALALRWDPRKYELSDAGNAERFVAARGHDFHYVYEWKRWVKWDGTRWMPRSDGPVRLAFIPIIRELYKDAARIEDKSKRESLISFARSCENRSRTDGAVSFIQNQLEASVELFDTDPYLLNVQNGTIDLRTGELKPHSRKDLITKLAPVKFDAKAKAPRFLKFLKQILVDDELIAFVQRFLGYSLTGLTKERTIAVLHGVGKNGKSTLVELFHDLLGDYASTTKSETIMQQRSGNSQDYFLAELTGIRFLAISETKRGQELDEATVKQITGGDTISARAIYGRPITYRPQFTIWMSTNHKPEIPDGSEAIWDRLRLIPFLKRFEGKGADTKLPEKLREELPGILAWAVRGCVEWAEYGLGSAAAVDRATSEYRSETDVIARFLEEMCVFGPELEITKTDMHDAYEQWCMDENEESKTPKAFTTAMNERGVVKGFFGHRTKKSRVWKGVALRGEDRGGENAEEENPVSPPLPHNSESVTSEESVTSQNSCKQEGGEEEGCHIDSNSQYFYGNLPHVETLSEKPKPVTCVTPRVTTPLSWDFEDGRINYMPEEK